MRTAHRSITDSVVHLFICSDFFLLTSSVSVLAVAELVCCEHIAIPNIVIIFIVKITASQNQVVVMVATKGPEHVISPL